VPVEKLETAQEVQGNESAHESICPCMCDAHDSTTREARTMMKGARDLQGDGGSAPDFDEPSVHMRRLARPTEIQF
jgi:hypothetical protein